MECTPYKRESILEAIHDRGKWLLAFFIGLLLAAAVVERFEHILREQVELSYFVPLLIGHGGNTGSQSVSTVIRALALDQIRAKDAFAVLWKESTAGAIMGLLLGCALFLISFVGNVAPSVAITVMVALPLVSLWANFLGGLFPLLAVRFGLNPATCSAPLMTTIVDASGLMIYFRIGEYIISR